MKRFRIPVESDCVNTYAHEAIKSLSQSTKATSVHNIPAATAIVITLALWPLQSCDRGPTPLIAGVQSRLTVDAATQALQISPEMWKVEQNYKRSGAQVLILRVFRFTHLGDPGELFLHFLDNRLWRVVFFPTEASRYMAKLEREVGQSFDEDVNLPPDTRIRLRVDGSGRQYMEWTDKTIRREFFRRMD